MVHDKAMKYLIEEKFSISSKPRKQHRLPGRDSRIRCQDQDVFEPWQLPSALKGTADRGVSGHFSR